MNTFCFFLERAKSFFFRETVLCIAIAAAAVSIFFVPPSSAYLGYIDWKVLLCLFCLMSVVAGLRASGAFDILASSILRFAGNVRSLAAILIITTFFVAMAITNDVALITFVPFALLLMRNSISWRTRAHIVTLQTIAANVGSSLTPVGNPQNLYLFAYYHMPSEQFFAGIFPIVITGFALLILGLTRIKPQTLYAQHTGHNFSLKKKRFSIFIVLFILSVLTVFRVLDYRLVTALVIVAVLVLDRELLLHVDYSLLFTFLGFFVFIGNLQRIEAVRSLLTALIGENTVLVSALASQLISNVPAAILLSRFTPDSVALLRGVSIGGMGTIIASLASVISFKFLSHEHPSEALGYLAIFTKWNVIFFVALYLVNLVV